MGMFDSFFGPKHPPLPEDDPAAKRIVDSGDAFVTFVASAHDTIEVLPGEGPLYVFVGKPPKAFGIVWFEAGKQFDVRSLTAAGVLASGAGPRLANELGVIYTRHTGHERFAFKVGGHAVTVTPASDFYAEVDQAINRASSAPQS